MKLEIGSKYKTRNGDVAVVLAMNPFADVKDPYPYISIVKSYGIIFTNAEGRHYLQKECEFDLIDKLPSNFMF